MKKIKKMYSVLVKDTAYWEFTIEAESEEDAEQKAIEMTKDSDNNPDYWDGCGVDEISEVEE